MKLDELDQVRFLHTVSVCGGQATLQWRAAPDSDVRGSLDGGILTFKGAKGVTHVPLTNVSWFIPRAPAPVKEAKKP